MVKHLHISSYAIIAAAVIAITPTPSPPATSPAALAFDAAPVEPSDWPDAWTFTPAVNDASLPTVVPLYGSLSGFAKAREGRTSIVVGALPESAGDVDHSQVTETLEAWNAAAGWTLFSLDINATEPDVMFRDIAGETCPNYGACAGWEQFDSGWYRQCVVMLWPWATDTNVLIHEMGHCLGFEDVVTTVDTNYRGVMSYARDRTGNVLGEQDVASLTAVGYRDAV